MFIAHLATRYARVYPVQVVKIMTTTEMRVSRKNKSVFLSLEEEENILLQKKISIYGCDLSLYLLCNQSYLLQQLCNQFSLLFYVENCDAKNDVKIKVLKNNKKKTPKMSL